MKVVLRSVLARAEVRAGTDGLEPARRRSITISPRHGAPAVLHDRGAQPAAP